MRPIPIDPRRPQDAWGMIHPSATRTEWRVKCGGTKADYIRIEGLFYPLPRPVADGQDLLVALHDAHRENPPGFSDCDWPVHDEIWSGIKDAVGFEFQVVSPPPAEDIGGDLPATVPENQEGLLWVDITAATGRNLAWLTDLPQPLTLVTGNSD